MHTLYISKVDCGMIVVAQVDVVFPVTPYLAVSVPTFLTRVTQSLWSTNRTQNLLNTAGNAYNKVTFVNTLMNSKVP